MSSHPISEHRFDVPDADPATVLRQVEESADAWGAAWKSRDRGLWLQLPVLASVRHGWVAGNVDAEPDGDGTRLVYRVDDSYYRLNRATVFTLVLAAFGALTTMIAPFFPSLIQLMPMGIVLTVAAWLFVVVRLRNSGPEEFFEDVLDEVAASASPEE